MSVPTGELAESPAVGGQKTNGCWTKQIIRKINENIERRECGWNITVRSAILRGSLASRRKKTHVHMHTRVTIYIYGDITRAFRRDARADVRADVRRGTLHRDSRCVAHSPGRRCSIRSRIVDPRAVETSGCRPILFVTTTWLSLRSSLRS